MSARWAGVGVGFEPMTIMFCWKLVLYNQKTNFQQNISDFVIVILTKGYLQWKNFPPAYFMKRARTNELGTRAGTHSYVMYLVFAYLYLTNRQLKGGGYFSQKR